MRPERVRLVCSRNWRSGLRKHGSAAVLLALALDGPAARADELGDLEKAYGAYVAHNYDRAESRLRALLEAKSGGLKDPESIADARMYLSAVLLAEGKKDEAAGLLEALLLDNPDYQPDPLRVPLPALDALVDARLRLRDKLVSIQATKVHEAAQQEAKAGAEKRRSAERLATLERLASEEIVVERHSRGEALIPFGVGQFQNRQVALGWSFVAGEVLLAAGSAIGFGLTLYNESLAYDALQNRSGTAPQYQARAYEAATVANVFAAGFAAAAIGGIVQAQLAFVPQHVHIELHRRTLPTLSLAPTVEPGGVGMRGMF